MLRWESLQGHYPPVMGVSNTSATVSDGLRGDLPACGRQFHRRLFGGYPRLQWRATTRVLAALPLDQRQLTAGADQARQHREVADPVGKLVVDQRQEVGGEAGGGQRQRLFFGPQPISPTVSVGSSAKASRTRSGGWGITINRARNWSRLGVFAGMADADRTIHVIHRSSVSLTDTLTFRRYARRAVIIIGWLIVGVIAEGRGNATRTRRGR